VRRGEVWWHEPPDVKRRPVLILSRNEAIDRLHDVLVVPTTRTIRGIETEVQLDESDGMLAACVLSLDNAFLAEKAVLSKRITKLGVERMDEVCRALDVASGC
jgi:mRNA interferase MazF